LFGVKKKKKNRKGKRRTTKVENSCLFEQEDAEKTGGSILKGRGDILTIKKFC